MAICDEPKSSHEGARLGRVIVAYVNHAWPMRNAREYKSNWEWERNGIN
jgi:hypothetical protein